MHWRKCTYWLIGLCFISSAIVKTVMKAQDITGPLAWGNILSQFGAAMTFILIGLSIILDYKHLLDWFGVHLHWEPSACSFRVLGFGFLVGGLLLLAPNVMNAFAALGIIPNPYLP
mgnify:CR=1 FL=1